jgi:hypothetical protein
MHVRRAGGVTFIDVEVRQRVGRFTITGFGSTDFICDGTTQTWAVEVFGQTGQFRGGHAVSVTFAVACGEFSCGEDFEEDGAAAPRVGHGAGSARKGRGCYGGSSGIGRAAVEGWPPKRPRRHGRAWCGAARLPTRLGLEARSGFKHGGRRGGWHDTLNHYLFCFHDSMFESLARSLSIRRQIARPCQLLHDLTNELLD